MHARSPHQPAGSPRIYEDETAPDQRTTRDLEQLRRAKRPTSHLLSNQRHSHAEARMAPQINKIMEAPDCDLLPSGIAQEG